MLSLGEELGVSLIGWVCVCVWKNKQPCLFVVLFIETVSASKEVAVAKEKEQDDDDDEEEEEEEGDETPPLADGETSPADPETSPPDAKTLVVAKKSKKTASWGGWKKTAKKITEQLCDIELTQSPVYSLKDSFMHKVGTSCLLLSLFCIKINYNGFLLFRKTFHTLVSCAGGITIWHQWVAA